jgi:hypothetical protein
VRQRSDLQKERRDLCTEVVCVVSSTPIVVIIPPVPPVHSSTPVPTTALTACIRDRLSLGGGKMIEN